MLGRASGACVASPATTRGTISKRVAATSIASFTNEVLREDMIEPPVGKLKRKLLFKRRRTWIANRAICDSCLAICIISKGNADATSSDANAEIYFPETQEDTDGRRGATGRRMMGHPRARGAEGNWLRGPLDRSGVTVIGQYPSTVYSHSAVPPTCARPSSPTALAQKGARPSAPPRQSAVKASAPRKPGSPSPGLGAEAIRVPSCRHFLARYPRRP